MEGDVRPRRRLAGAVALTALIAIAVPSSALATKAKLRIDDAPAVREPSSGTTPQKFKVSLSKAVGHTVTFDFQTYDGSATVAGGDYDAASGTGQIDAGKRSAKVKVTVKTDTIPEPTEAYGVAISNVHGAKLSAHKDASGSIKDGNKHESEPNNVFVRANPVTEIDAIGAHFALGDTDFFTFTAGFTGGEAIYTSAYGDFSCSPGAGQIDTLVTVYNSSHAQIAQSDDQSGTDLCSQASFTMTQGQTYYFEVTDGAAGGGSIFDYTLNTFAI